MPWTAQVINGDSWLSIISGSSGTDSGTIQVSFTENTSTSSRIGTIRVTATGASGSPKDVTVTQAGTGGVQQYNLITNVQGSISLNPSGGVYDSGTQIELTANASSGWHFVGWEGDITGSTNPITITMNSDKSVTANFVVTYTLSTSVSPSGGGSVTKSPNKSSYNYNESVQLTANASSGYTFSNWSGYASGSSNPTTINMTTNKSVTANFTASKPTVSIAAIDPSAAEPADNGSFIVSRTGSICFLSDRYQRPSDLLGYFSCPATRKKSLE